MEEPKEHGDVLIEKGEVTEEQLKEIEAGEFLTPGEVADKLRYSYQWVLWMLQEGRIKGIKPLGSRWRIARSEYEHILKEGTPPLPRDIAPAQKLPVTTIQVDDKKIIDKIKEPPKREEPPGLPFPFSLFGPKGGKK